MAVETSDVVVIGAGVSGLVAAGFAKTAAALEQEEVAALLRVQGGQRAKRAGPKIRSSRSLGGVTHAGERVTSLSEK